MFHRPRNDTQDTAMTDTQDTTVTIVQATSSSDNTTQPQTPDAKEDTAMSNTYTPTPSYNTPDQTQDTTAQATPYAPTTAPFANRVQNQAQRSPYAYAQNFTPATETSVSTGRKLVIGEGITLSGEIEACDHLVVEGTVEATLKGASVMDISQSGMFFGAVEINEATIAGRFEGDLVVNGRLTVRATGTVMGTISYKELAVESGATIDGKINPLSTNRIATAEKKSSAPRVPLGKSSQTSNEAANELPFASAKTAAA